jgi:putative ABC transport system permease protein
MPDWRYAIGRRLDGLRLPPTREAEVVEELSQHLDDRYAELRSEGASEEEARRDALAELDAADLIAELTGVESTHVEPLPIGGGTADGAVSGAWQDVRYGGRMLRKESGASLVIVLTLGLAIAANAIVFAFADLLLLRPLPIGNASRLVAIFGIDGRQATDRLGVSAPDYQELRAQMTTAEDVLAMRTTQLSLTGDGEPIVISAAHASTNLFTLWDVPPVLGRLPPPDPESHGLNRVAMLSHHFWQGHFAGDTSIVGRALTLNGTSYTVGGVVTPNVEIGTLAQIDVWVPLDLNTQGGRELRPLVVMALLKPGATLATANAELVTVSSRLQRSFPATDAAFSLHAISLRESTAGSSTWIVLALLGVVVGLVLLAACANVATMMLARASARRRELAVRVALGATRARLVRQLIAEGALLGLASGALGVAFAYGGLTAFKLASPELYFRQLTINGNLIAFALALTVLTPMLFGLLPALQSSRPDLNEDLKDGGRSASASARGNRSRSTLLVAQVAFALAVLIVSGLIVRTVQAIQHLPLGINPDGLMAMRVRFDPPNYNDDGARMRSMESMLHRLAAVPGVTSAAATRGFIVVDGEPIHRFAIDGRAAAAPGDAPWACEAAVFGDYTRTLGTPLLAGRMWEPGDAAASWAVAVVNREAVRRYWPSQSPVGEHFRMLDEKGNASGPEILIVGVIENVIGADPMQPAPPRIYRPLASQSVTGVGFLVRTSGDVAMTAPAIREALRAEDRRLAVSEVRTVRSQLDDFLRSYDLIMAMFVGFAAIGLVVAVAGVYGVTAFSVGQRRHEIGVRVALGATAANILHLIASRTVRLFALGAALGGAAGWAIGLTMRGLLVRIGAADPVTYVSAFGLIALCAMVATYVPAFRAISIDPMAVLKRD